jgi:putative membrane protein
MSPSIHLEVLIVAAVLAVAYAAAWRASGERVQRVRAAAFGAGLVSLIVALNGPIHDLAEGRWFSAHMAQHLILTLVTPPLLLAGTPAFMADALLDGWLSRAATRAVLRILTRPLPALAAWSIALFAWHLPRPYAAALDSHALHFVQHATLVGAALLAWWPVQSPSRRLPALPYAAQILYLFVFGVPMTIVAAMITGAEGVLYPSARSVGTLTALEDQRLGGILMWVPAAIVPLAAFTAVFFRWAAAESEDADEANAPDPDRPLAFPK